MATTRAGRCTHPLWRFPNPLPCAGERCPDCGARYVPPNPDIAASQCDTEGRRLIEELRALVMLRALRVMADDKELSSTQAARERQRLCRRRGWLIDEAPADVPPALAC